MAPSPPIHFFCLTEILFVQVTQICILRIPIAKKCLDAVCLNEHSFLVCPIPHDQTRVALAPDRYPPGAPPRTCQQLPHPTTNLLSRPPTRRRPSLPHAASRRPSIMHLPPPAAPALLPTQSRPPLQAPSPPP
jgi:hypothetical protein